MKQKSAGAAGAPRRMMLLLATALAAAVFAGGAAAAEEQTPVGVTSRAARQDAIREIPLSKLDGDARRKASSVLTSTAIFRRLPTVTFDCDEELFHFLVQNPEVVVNMWQELDVTDASLDRTGEMTFDADDGAGTRGKLEVLYQTPKRHLVYADGYYEGKLLPRRLRGRTLISMQTDFERNADGRQICTCRLDTFIQLDSLGLELLAHTIQPLIGRTADANFRETAAFVGGFSRAAELNSTTVERLISKLDQVDPASVDRLAQITDRMSAEASIERTATLRRKTEKSARRVKTSETTR